MYLYLVTYFLKIFPPTFLEISKFYNLFIYLFLSNLSSVQVQKSHPQELLSLLKKLVKYLYHNTWETRQAASLAVEAILNHVPVWRPAQDDKNDDPVVKTEQEQWMTLAEFDVKKLLQSGEFLPDCSLIG